MQKDNNEESEIKSYKMLSNVLPGGVIVEAIYEPETHAVKFAVSTGEKVEILEELPIDSKGRICSDESLVVHKFVPNGGIYELVKKKLIHLASGVEEYEDIHTLYKDIKAFIKEYVVLQDERFYDVAVGYVLMSWLYDKFNTIPYLRVIGDFGTGKSRVLDVIGKLCNRVIMASGSISTSAVFRTLDFMPGTLVFDEADFRSSEIADDITKLLNGGNKKDAPVIRVEKNKDKFETKVFVVFGPKIFGSRQSFSDTALESRCITLRLFPLKKIDVPIHLPKTFDLEVDSFRKKLLNFRFKNFHKISEDETSIGDISFPRLKQTALALTSIMKYVGEDEHKVVLSYLLDYQKELLGSVGADVNADIVLCVARMSYFSCFGKIYISDIAREFNSTFYDDYTSKETHNLRDKEGSPLAIKGQVVSARKVGVYIDNLGITKIRDARGIYIPITTEMKKINSLVERYGLLEIILKEKEEREKTGKVPRNCFAESLKQESNEFKEDEQTPF